MSAADDIDLTPDRPGVARVRARTLSVSRLSQRDLRAGAMLYPERPGVDYERPRTYGDCERAGLGTETPCPFVSCSRHLALDVNPHTGSIKHNRPDLEVDEMGPTCSLAVADRGGLTLEETGEVLNLTRERVRQLETRALAKVRAAMHGINPADLSALDDAWSTVADPAEREVDVRSAEAWR